MATSAELQVVIRAQDQASGVLKSLGASVGGLEKAFSVLPNTIKAVTGALGQIGLAAAGIEALTGAAKGAGNALGLGLASQMEQVTARFNAFTKDGAATEKILAQVREEANRTPFAFAEMANAAAMLLPASKSAQGGLMGLIKEAEILAALNPSEGLEGAAFALREALSGDFISVMERFNIPRELINRLKAEGVPSAQIVGRALKEMGADFSLVSNLANTTQGRLSTFQDAIDSLRMIAGQPILEALGRSLDRLSAAVSENEGVLREFFAILGAGAARAVDLAVDAFFGMVDAVRAVAPILRELGNAFTALAHGDIDNFVAGVQRAAEIVWQALSGRIAEAVEAVRSAFSDFAPTGERLGQVFDFIGERIAEAAPVAEAFTGAVAGMAEASGGVEGILDRVAEAVNAVSGALEEGVRLVQTSTQVQGALGTAAGALAAALGVQAVAWVANTAAMLATRGAAAAMAAAQATLNIVLTANPIGILVVALGALVGALVTAYNTNETFRNTVNAAWEAVKGAVLTAVAAVQQAIAGLSAWFQAQGGTFSGAATAIGTAIWQGIVSGISGGLAAVRNAAVNLATQALNSAKAALGVASPSREFMEVGEDVVEGFVLGVEDNATEAVQVVGDAMEAVVGAATSPFEGLAELVGAQFERTFGVVEKAQVDIENARDQISRNANRAREIEERQHQRRLQDLQEELGSAQGKARAAVLERIQKQHEAHARKIEDIEAQMYDRLDELAVDSADKLRDAREKEALQRGAALRDLQRDIERIERDVADKRAEIAEKANEARLEALKDAAEKEAEVRSRAVEQVQELLGRRELEQQTDARKDALKDQQDQESRARKERLEDEELVYRRDRDLAKAKTDEDRTQIRERFAEAQRDLARRRGLEADEREFRKRQEQERHRLERALEDESLQRQIQRIAKERDERIDGIRIALADKLERVRRTEAEENAELARSASQKLADLKERFFDRIGPLTQEAKGRFEELFRGIRDSVGEAAEAVERLARAMNRTAGGTQSTGADLDYRAADGQTLGGQSGEVQAAFRAAHGGNASRQWAIEHNNEIGAGNSGGGPVPLERLRAGEGYTGSAADFGLSHLAGRDLARAADELARQTGGGIQIKNPGEVGVTFGLGGDPDLLAILLGQQEYSIPEGGNNFGGGGIVPGRAGAAALATVHGGEGVFTPDQMAVLGGYIAAASGGGYGAGGGHGHDIYLDGELVGRAVWNDLKGRRLVGTDLGLT